MMGRSHRSIGPHNPPRSLEVAVRRCDVGKLCVSTASSGPLLPLCILACLAKALPPVVSGGPCTPGVCSSLARVAYLWSWLSLFGVSWLVQKSLGAHLGSHMLLCCCQLQSAMAYQQPVPYVEQAGSRPLAEGASCVSLYAYVDSALVFFGHKVLLHPVVGAALAVLLAAWHISTCCWFVGRVTCHRPGQQALWPIKCCISLTCGCCWLHGGRWFFPIRALRRCCDTASPAQFAWQGSASQASAWSVWCAALLFSRRLQYELHAAVGDLHVDTSGMQAMATISCGWLSFCCNVLLAQTCCTNGGGRARLYPVQLRGTL